MTRVTAADAMATAKQALADISAHEQVCAERYAHIAESGVRVEGAVAHMASAHAEAIKEMRAEQKQATDDIRKEQKDATDGIYKRLWWFASVLGAGMFAIIMALIFK